MKYFAAATLFLSVSVISSFAQEATSRLDGTVTDAQGAVVPDAKVDLVKKSEGQSFSTRTDGKGYWVVASLPSDTYSITITKTGFKTEKLEAVMLAAGVPATVNTKLEVGALTETIEVSGGAEVVQSDTATVSETLQGNQIHDLPFTSHNVTELIATQPGS